MRARRSMRANPSRPAHRPARSKEAGCRACIERSRSRCLSTNFGEHLARRVTEKLFFQLLAPPKVLAGKFVPGIGLADTLEAASVPQQHDVENAMRALAATQP